jgi:transglutaminase-like putative cysteine protease
MRSIILVTAIASAYALLRGWPDGMHPLLRACSAVLVLVLGLGLWRRRDNPAGPRAAAARKPRWSDYLAMGLGVLAVECFFLFFLTITPPKAEELALQLEETIRPELAARRRAAADGPGGTARNVSGNWLWDSQGNRPLPRRIAARPSNKPEVFFQADDATHAGRLLRHRAYIHAFSLERYRNATWSPVPIPAQTLAANDDGLITFPQPGGRPGAAVSGEIFHNLHPGGQNVLTAPQGLDSVELPIVRRIAPGIVRLNPLPPGSTGYRYRTDSRPLTLDALLASNSALNLQPAADAPEHLLALPEDEALRGSLVQIAIKTLGPIESRLIALRKFLNTNCRYSLTVENPDNLDPIENFLFHERRGHCEFFATTAALLCRTLGVPARVSYGWSGGRHYESQNLIMFRAKEAHAWTEILLEGYGWVVFDTTPPGALDAASSSVAGENETPPLDEDGNITEESEEGAVDDPLIRWGWTAFAAGAVLLPLAILLLAVRKKPNPGIRPESHVLLPDPPGYLVRFKQACLHLGHPMPPGRTLRQHLAHLARHDAAPVFADDLLDYHYTTTYGPVPPDRSREKVLARSIAGWE